MMTKDLNNVPTTPPKEETPAKAFVKQVNLNLNDIKHSFFTIGQLLFEASRKRYYRELGYENITECAEDLFGFKKTTTYDLMTVYEDFHERKAPAKIQSNVENFSQTQLVILSKLQYCRDSFIELARPEDTVETFRKAKNLWNKIYNKGHSPSGNYKTLTEFLDINEPIYTSRPVLSSSKPDLSVQTENYIEVTPTNVETVAVDQEELTEDFSVQTENLGEFATKALKEYIERMGYKTNFEPDKNKPGIRVLPDHLSKSVLGGLARAFANDRTQVKHTITKHIIDKLGTFEYDIMLYGRKQNFNVFAGTLSGIIVDYLIKEFGRKENK